MHYEGARYLASKRACVSQLDMYFERFNKIPGCANVPKPNFAWPEKGLDKLRVDIVPTPDPSLHVIPDAWLYPLRDKLVGYISDVKIEDVGGSGMCGVSIPTDKVKEGMEIMEFWGWKTELYSSCE